MKHIVLVCVASVILLMQLGCENNNPLPEIKEEPTLDLTFEVQKDNEADNDYVINPFDYAPMTAGVKFLLKSEREESSKVTATVTVVGQKASPDFVKEYVFNSDNVNTQWLPIVGLYTGESTVKVVVKEGADNILYDTTYTILLTIPSEDLGQAQEASLTGLFAGDEMIFVLYNTSKAIAIVFRGIIYDTNGNIRWYSSIPNSYMQFILNGQLYVGFKGPKINRLGVYDFLGQEKADWELPGYEDIHHDLVRNTVGNFVLTVSKDDNSPVEEFLIEFNPNSNQTNKIVNSIDLSTIFPNVDDLFNDLPQAQLGGTRQDNVHNNALSYYQKNGQTVYVCSSQRSGIAAVDQNGFPQWYFFPKHVQYSDFNDSMSGERLPARGNFPRLDYSTPPTYARLLVDPVDANGDPITDTEVTDEGKVKQGIDFIYPYRQHGVQVVDYDDNSVTFIVLDNATFQGFEARKSDAVSRAVCYKVVFSASEYGGTVQQLWSKSMEFFSPFLGSSYKTPSGNYIFTFGAIGSTRIQGDDYDYRNSADQRQSVIVELSSLGQEQGRLTIPTTDATGRAVGTFRAERVKL